MSKYVRADFLEPVVSSKVSKDTSYSIDMSVPFGIIHWTRLTEFLRVCARLRSYVVYMQPLF